MDYRIIYIDLPCRLKAMTVMDNDGFYNIYVNARLSFEMQQEAIEHELTHIDRDDFYRCNEALEKVETM